MKPDPILTNRTILKSMKLLNVVMVSIALFITSCTPKDKTVKEVSSPQSKAKIVFNLDENGQPYYLAYFNNQVVLDTSYLGLELMDGPHLKDNFKIINSDTLSFDETWEQPWGEQQFIRNNYNELKVSLEQQDRLARKLDLVFHVYDYGIGFRYEFPEQQNLKEFQIKDELTEFTMTGDHAAWWIPAFEFNRYEYLYKNTPLTKMGNKLGKVHTPVTFETDNGIYLSIHEAALTDYSSMVIDASSHSLKLKCELVPYEKDGEMKAIVKAPGKTPWRTIQIANKPGDLITSYLILNLNEPNTLGDVSWVKPGKYVGIWWEIHIGLGSWDTRGKHAATTENTKKYIDFAAKHRFDGVLVEGWNVGWDGNWFNNGSVFSFTQSYPDYDIEEVSRYAKEKGVYMISHHETSGDTENYESQMEAAYQQMERLGMKAVKTGYVEHGNVLANGKSHHGQYFVGHHLKVIREAAKHHIAVVEHEPIKDTGERRTYPNMISREGARGQEFNAWSEDGGNPPNHQTILPFTRYLSGPMDFTPGVFDIKIPSKPKNQVNTTLAKQLALYVTIYSPMQMACDLPENYDKYPDAFDFIKEVGTDWETTKVLDAAIGEYITVARKERGTGKWFVGTITNETPREVTIDFSFLNPYKKYIAKIYRDGNNAHYINNPEDYIIEQKEITTKDKLTVQLAASGGAAITLTEK